LEIRAEQILPGSEGGDGGRGGEMAQTMCAHMNKRIKKFIELYTKKVNFTV
jgi:hypothetical protein